MRDMPTQREKGTGEKKSNDVIEGNESQIHESTKKSYDEINKCPVHQFHVIIIIAIILIIVINLIMIILIIIVVIMITIIITIMITIMIIIIIIIMIIIIILLLIPIPTTSSDHNCL